MGYLNSINDEMARLLRYEVHPDDWERIVAFTKDKALESYKNGLRDGRGKGEPASPVGRQGSRPAPRADRRERPQQNHEARPRR